jgi:hypothetical protein
MFFPQPEPIEYMLVFLFSTQGVEGNTSETILFNYILLYCSVPSLPPL